MNVSKGFYEVIGLQSNKNTKWKNKNSDNPLIVKNQDSFRHPHASKSRTERGKNEGSVWRRYVPEWGRVSQIGTTSICIFQSCGRECYVATRVNC